jgi:carboxyl-terminal processing protease
MAKGAINKFAVNYVDNHRKELKKLYKSDDEYAKNFEVTDDMLKSLFDIATNDGVEYNEEEATQSKALFKMITKALIGRDVWEQATYFKVYNRYDPIFKEALRVINSDDYNSLIGNCNQIKN